jgi:CRP-like cAMP-binding protein
MRIMDHEQASDLIDRYMLNGFVPLNALSRTHLQYLLRDHRVETRVAGSRIFSRGERDGYHVFLLHGAIELRDAGGASQLIEAGDEASLWPVGDHLERIHDAIAIGDCGIIRFERELLDRMLCWDQVTDFLISDISGRPGLDADADWMITLLRSNLFYKVPPMNMERVFDRFKPLAVPAGTTIVRQGETGDRCYVIKQGRAEVLRQEPGEDKPRQLAILEPGRCFGDDALYLETTRNATVTMIDDGILMSLAKSDYQQLMPEPAIRRIDPAAARTALDTGAVMLDVRGQLEYESGHCPGAVNFPLNLLILKSPLLVPGRRYFTCCNSGRRSQAAAYLLERHGHDVAALWPGIEAAAVGDRDWLVSERNVEHWISADGTVAAS